MGKGTAIEWADATWHEKTAAKRIGVSIDEYLSRCVLGQKWCTRCKDWHSRFVFTKDSSRGDGLNASCRPKQISRPPRTKEERRELRNATYRRYYAGEPGAIIRERIYARKRNSEPISPRHRELIMEKFDGKCAYCGKPANTIDHVLAVTKGGGSSRGNLLPACRSCNSRKRTKDFDEFLKSAPNPSDLIAEELCMAEVL